MSTVLMGLKAKVSADKRPTSGRGGGDQNGIRKEKAPSLLPAHRRNALSAPLLAASVPPEHPVPTSQPQTAVAPGLCGWCLLDQRNHRVKVRAD